ncbi:MAG TPA: hypothetical protein VNF29_13970 [Candidatus Binataceae bacterium]|nr:hypothetical protein [Candidatus Binataceae bacterium]
MTTPQPVPERCGPHPLAAIAIGLALLAACACTKSNSPRGVVDRFITAHYMAIDLKSTEPLCTGLALDKLHQEMKLTQGQAIDETTRKPVIHYKLEAERDAPDHIQYVFRATIDVPEGGSFEKNWMITARKERGAWKVSNYSEYD